MFRIRRYTVLVFLLISLLFSGISLAQGTLTDYQHAERFLRGNLTHLVYSAGMPTWTGKGDTFWYLESSAQGKQFILVDAAQNTSRPAFDHARLAAALSHAAGGSYTATNLPFAFFDFSDDQSAITFGIGPAEWRCTLKDYRCSKNAPAAEERLENLSPNGLWAAYVQDHNLFVRDTSTGQTIQLTRDGVPGWDYARPLPDLSELVRGGVSRGEDVNERPEVFWSPDSSKLVTFRIDSRNSGRFSSLQFVPPGQIRPKSYDYVYPLPAEELPSASVLVFDVLTGKRFDVKTEPLEIPFQGGPGYFEWFPDSKSFYYEHGTRGNQEVELRVVNAETGEQKTIISEQDGLYIDPGEHFFRYVPDNGGIVWSSEKDGWNQLYLYDDDGQFKNQITKGDWVVRELEHIDAKKHQVYFLASGREKGEDPYLTHLYRINFDGSDLQLLTPENANHTVTMSPDGQYFVDSYSRVDLPGETILRRSSDGSDVRVLQKTDISGLQKLDWKPPEPFKGTATDGKTNLYGVIVRPTNFDSSRKYPIVEYVYTGPQGFFVPKTFLAGLNLQSTAELGFVVVMVDGRGTTGRSRAFHEFSYHNLGGSFADHVAMIKQMAAKYPYMDITRVGIYGTSAGGYGSVHAILQFPDFYKVCVSTSGDHDARLDKAWWNEQYQGWPVGDDYAEQSNVTMADHLKGHLLLIHGDIDNNVHPVETMRLVDALMTANRSFDMLFVPNMLHGDSGPHAHYVTRRRWDYLVQYLLGVIPPENFEIHEAPLPPFRRRQQQ